MVSVSACLFVGERFFFMGTGSRRPHHSHCSHRELNRRSSFCSGRGENLFTIASFGKPLFADMHHRVHAVAGALRRPKLHARTQTSPLRLDGQCDGDEIDAEFAHSADASVLTFVRPNLFRICTNFYAKNEAIDFKCIENHGGTTHSKQRAASGAPPEPLVVQDSSSLLRERATLSAWCWIFKL